MKYRLLTALVAILCSTTAWGQDIASRWTSFNYNAQFSHAELMDGKLYVQRDYRMFVIDTQSWSPVQEFTAENGISVRDIIGFHYSEEAECLSLMQYDGTLQLLYPDGTLYNNKEMAATPTQGFDRTVLDVQPCGGQLFAISRGGVTQFDLCDRSIRDTWFPASGTTMAFVHGQNLFRITPQGGFRANRQSNTYYPTAWVPCNLDGVMQVAVGKAGQVGSLCALRKDHGGIDMLDGITGVATPLPIPIACTAIKWQDGRLLAWNEGGQICCITFQGPEGTPLVQTIDTTIPNLQDLALAGQDIYVLRRFEGMYSFALDPGAQADLLHLTPTHQGLPVSIAYYQSDAYMGSMQYRNGRVAMVNAHVPINASFMTLIEKWLCIGVFDTQQEQWHNIYYSDLMSRVGEPGHMRGTTCIDIDPIEPERYYVGTIETGVYVIDHDTVATRWDHTNSPIQAYADGWNDRVSALLCTDEGGLWMACSYVTPNALIYRSHSGDWMTFPMGDVSGQGPIASLTHTRQNGHGYVIANSFMKYKKCVAFAFDYGASVEDTSDDRTIAWYKYVDQYSNEFTPTYLQGTFADSRGRIWQMTRTGVFYYPSADQLFSNIGHVVRPRVFDAEVGDSTFLLADASLRAMAEDREGTLWFGTLGQGLYRYDATGTRLLLHLTPDNSELADGEILSLAYDSINNQMWISTLGTIARFDVPPVHDDMQGTVTSVFCHPSAVAVGQHQPLHVVGLADGSTCTITNTQGDVTMTTARAVGQMASFDTSAYPRGTYLVVGKALSGQQGVLSHFTVY